MNAGFLMNGNPVRTGFGERRDVVIGIFDHQVAVERNIHRLAQAGDDRRANGDVGHEMTVHHVDMQQCRAPTYGRVSIFRQASEISRQNGRRYLNQDKLLSRRISLKF